MSLEAVWGELERAALGEGASVTVRRIRPDLPDNVFAGLRQPGGTRLLILQLPSRPRLSRNALVQSRGFRNYLTRFEGDPEIACSVVIEAAANSFNELFAVLAFQVVTRLERRGAGETAVAAFLACLHEWKRFFDSGRAEGLSPEQALGLFAELVFLRDEALRYAADPLTALAAWVGPDPLCKDFQFPTCAIEVKATGGSEPAKIRVSGERQLDEGGFPALFLSVLLVERSASAGQSLPELVEEVRAGLGEGRARFLLEEKLQASGYYDVHREQYAARFVVREQRLFQVRPGFPRLTGAVPPGVGDLSYSVTLAACAPFSTTNDALAALLRASPAYDA